MNETDQILMEILKLQKRQEQQEDIIRQLLQLSSASVESQQKLGDAIQNLEQYINHDIISQIRVIIDGINENMKYEVIDYIQKHDDIFFPQFESFEETVDKIVNQRKSLARFGDGEFSMIERAPRQDFQKYNEILSDRLKMVLQSKDERLLIGIANHYGDLSCYTTEAKNAIRYYMTSQVREQHMRLLDRDRVYEDAYLTRWYIIYNDKEQHGPEHRLCNLRRIWNKRKVIAVEGAYTRLGLGNDLFDNAESFRRIIAPGVSSYDKYDEILSACKQYGDTDTLFLLAIGPSSGVLAYDLVQEGLQAVDVGHIDLEYMWYLKGAKEKIYIPDRYCNEVTNAIPERVQDKQYYEQILCECL